MTPEFGIGKRILEATGIQARQQKARELNMAFDQANQGFDLQRELVTINDERLQGKGQLAVRRCPEGGIVPGGRPEISLSWSSRKDYSCWHHKMAIVVEGRLVSVSGEGMNWGEELFLVVPNIGNEEAKTEFVTELRRKLAFAFDYSRCESFF